jgi:parvulin-like peptidyl-prolyl isomerase
VTACGLLALACGGEDPARVVVAEIGDLRLERAELDAATSAALAEAGPLEGADRDRVLSRLLDGVVEEKLLAGEAGRRGVTVADAEIAAYLSDLSAAPGGTALRDPAGARRHLAAAKLQEALLRAVGAPSDAEIDALAARMRSRDEAAGTVVVLRSLRLSDMEEALALRQRLDTKATTFDREARARDTEGGPPLQVPLARLPAEVGTALAALEPGQVTAPVSLHAGVYLFELVSRGPAAASGDRRAEARDELLRRRGEMAGKALLLDLKRRQPVRLHRDRLGFRYVEEGE